MAPVRSNSVRQLPIVPIDLLRKHRVYERFDNRFRACARLLQALWRERQGLPIGNYQRKDGAQRRIGSMIGTTAADYGRNFLSPEVAHLVRREIAYQETGALIDQSRLYSNLLSSMPLAFNMFAPLRFDFTLAGKVIRILLPDIDVAAVTDVWFEHSPGRRNPDLTSDRSAFDVAITYQRGDGKTGFLGIEVKYSETMGEPVPAGLNPRYEALAVASGAFKDPMSALLRANPLQQLFREHMLAQAALLRGDWAEARFVLISPGHNHLVQHSAASYSAHLIEQGEGQVGFANLHLEHFIEALGWAGEMDYAYALHDRYCDWCKVDDAVEAFLRTKRNNWQIAPPRIFDPVPLIGKAA